MRNFKIATALGLSLFVVGSAAAQIKASNAPIEVFAESFVADLKSKIGTYAGNVVIKQGDFNLRADTVRVNMVRGKPDKIYADGGVVVKSPAGEVSADAGVFDVTPRLINFTGNVVLTKDKSVTRGNALSYNLTTGTGTFGGAAAPAPGQPAEQNGRVQGVFTAPSSIPQDSTP